MAFIRRSIGAPVQRYVVWFLPLGMLSLDGAVYMLDLGGGDFFGFIKSVPLFDTDADRHALPTAASYQKTWSPSTGKIVLTENNGSTVEKGGLIVDNTNADASSSDQLSTKYLNLKVARCAQSGFLNLFQRSALVAIWFDLGVY